ncbi:PmoA family protein [Verrucomicrobia bacterium]|nr:PmoA family protein [Verrucomicrobiota bacterium]NCG27371.1 hypothetical protein [Verrucomicrobiales bacterium]
MKAHQWITLLLLGTLIINLQALEVSEDDNTIKILDGTNALLVYHKSEVLPPKGSDPSYKRSAFIHPLKTPKGAIVTSIHPDDHLHHVGLWHAWVNTSHGTEKIDFWNLKKKEGTVRYKKTISLNQESDKKGFTVLQEHIATYEGKKPITIIEESFSVGIVKEKNTYFIDYVSEQKNVTSQDLELPAYRYGGPIAYRGPANWTNENSQVLTSENKNRSNGHATRGKWCAFSGPMDDGNALVAILCHPANHDAPQRMRIWPPSSHNGAIFFNYVPAQENAWKLTPKKMNKFSYKIIISDTKIDKKMIESAWLKYANE